MWTLDMVTRHASSAVLGDVEPLTVKVAGFRQGRHHDMPADKEGSRMTIHLTLLCARPAETVFANAPRSERELEGVRAARASLPPRSSVIRSPSAGAALTAVALGLTATVEPALRDIDYGTWRGRTAADIAAADPYGYSAWLTDPDVAPHGGESVRRLCHRTGHWLSSLPPQTGPTLAVVDPAVMQALLVHALAEPIRAFRKLRVPPLHTVCLTCRGGVWSAEPADASSGRGPAQYPPLSVTALTAVWRTVNERGTLLCEATAA